MRARFVKVQKIAVVVMALIPFAGCVSSDDSGNSSGDVYSGAGFDPWYYGDYYYDRDVIVTPPPVSPDTPRPSHPIAMPPSSAPQPTPMPSIPSMPRPAVRR